MYSDNVLHFVVSYLLALYSPMLAFVAGIGKEALDVWRGGMAEAGDLIADWAGIIAVGW